MYIHMHSGYAFGQGFTINFHLNSGELQVNWEDGELNVINYTFKSKFSAIQEYLEDLKEIEIRRNNEAIVTVKYVDNEHESDVCINNKKLQAFTNHLHNLQDIGEVEYFLINGEET